MPQPSVGLRLPEPRALIDRKLPRCPPDRVFGPKYAQKQAIWGDPRAWPGTLGRARIPSGFDLDSDQNEFLGATL